MYATGVIYLPEQGIRLRFTIAHKGSIVACSVIALLK